MEIHKPKFVTGFIEEILVIVIGISLAVTAERLVEYFQHHKEAKGVVRRMITELRRDSSDLAYNIKYHKKAMNADSILTRWSKREIELTPDSLSVNVSRSLVFTFFASSTAEIEALKGAGKLYLIENHELLSNILKHYDRYNDFKITTDISIDFSNRLSNIYKEHASLNTNISNLQNLERVYKFNPQELERNLRGNKMYENLLQEKRVYDAFVIGQSQDALKRLAKITSVLMIEE
jgi:hypothetical protein